MGARRAVDRNTQQLREELQTTAAAGELILPAAIRQMRQALGMTQAEFAQTFRLTPRQVYELETGRANPTLETLIRIGKPFGFVIGFVKQPGAEAPPAYDVLHAWARLEQALATIGSDLNYPDRRNIGPRHILSYLENELRLSDAELHQVRELRRFRNQAARNPAFRIPSNDALHFRALVDDLVERINAKRADRPAPDPA